MHIIVLAAAAIVLALVAVTMMVGGFRLYMREGWFSYLGLPVVLAALCVASAASIASIGAAMLVTGVAT